MKEVFVIADNIVSPLGVTTPDNFLAIGKGLSAVKQHHDTTKSKIPFVASLFDPVDFQGLITEDLSGFTKFEQLLALSIRGTVAQAPVDISSSRTALIISSTKGNISLLEDRPISPELRKQINLGTSAKKIAGLFGVTTPPIVVSNACISGLVALITAKRTIEAGRYDTVIVSGADVITRFILSGFQSFQAVSDEICRPFDKDRKGINLGEAAATIVLSANAPKKTSAIQFGGGAVSNDANHISGPSRTGEELHLALENAIQESGVDKQEIGFISAHGTATLYNDDMESKALALAGLQQVPVNSLKAYYGHTLGAAGLLEVAISLESLRQGAIIPTKGFSSPGTAQPIQVCHRLQYSPLKAFLKTASGFGGCNAAVVFQV